MEFKDLTYPNEEPWQRAGDLGNFPQMEKNPPALLVLVVDDERLIRWSLAETLTKAGHAVIEAADGAAAMRALLESRPVDVVLLDFRLPDSDDLTLLTNIRRVSPSSCVVLMSAFGTPEVTQGALEIGACCVLSKPFDMNDILAVVASAYDSRRASGSRNP